MTAAERWRAIPGYVGAYEVSDLGRVRSLPRHDRLGRPVQGRVLKPAPDSGGYSTYNLHRDGQGCTHRAHCLVALAFVGPRPADLEVRHLDGDPSNNALVNLAYGTRSENQLDRIGHGTHQHARKTHCPRGHAYEGANLGLHRGRTNRYCRTCQRDSAEQQRRAAGVAPMGPKTHCPQGHPYDEANTYTSPAGKRDCRTCRRSANRKYDARRRQGVAA